MDQFNLILGFGILLLTGFVLIISLLRQVHQLEALIEEKTMSVNYYSKESLDRFEDISKLRMELVSLKIDRDKLQDEVLSLKAGIKIFSDRAEELGAELATKSTVEPSAEVVEVAEVAEVTEEVKQEPIASPIAAVSTPTNKPKNKNRRKK